MAISLRVSQPQMIVRPSLGRWLAFILSTAVLCGLEFVVPRVEGREVTPVTLLLTVLIGASLLLSARFPVYAGSAVILLSIIFVHVDHSNSAYLASYVVVGDWVAMGLVGPALVSLVAFEASVLSTSLRILPQIFSSVLASALTLGVGFGVLIYRRRIARAQERADHAEEELRGELSAALHDTVARDLVRISLAAQELSAGGDHIDPVEADEIEALAGSALGHVRKLIRGDSAISTADLVGTVEASKDMLTQRRIDLTVTLPEEVLDSLDPDQESLACLVVGEGATNALKYSASSSTAELTFTSEEDGSVSILLSSQISEVDRADSTLQGKFGLDHLAAAVATRGGRLWTRRSGHRWVLMAQIPPATGALTTAQIQRAVSGADRIDKQPTTGRESVADTVGEV